MGGQCAASASQSLPPERRELGLVLQDHALWPHMSLQANVAFALEMRGLPRAQIHERVQQTLGLVGLQGMGERLPGSLSGGQQQRAALACAVVERPDRKSTRLNSSHLVISYAVFCLKKK